MYTEDDLLMISGLQHLAFCERQWALIHLENIWSENRLTVEGKHLHERVHETEAETRKDVRVVRGLRLRSLRLGLVGVADVVEFHRDDAKGLTVPGLTGRWTVFPVEYKRGRPKPDRSDEVQLCAQALCLEEMLGGRVEAGAMFYATPRRRHDVAFDSVLREETERLSAQVHVLWEKGSTPKARYAPKCDNCSLIASCLPKASEDSARTGRYVRRALRESVACDRET